jgi:hypothetical protein
VNAERDRAEDRVADALALEGLEDANHRIRLNLGSG